jgi:cytochrome b
MPINGTGRKILVWDLPTRLFHWLIVALVPAAYATSRLNSMTPHLWVGEALLALLVFRVLLGFFGSETSRFANFLATPRTAVHHLAHLFGREPDQQPGHNPAGGWMVVSILLLLFAEVLTGIYINNDVADEGPLTESVPVSVANAITALHWIIWDAILAAVGLHVLAIMVYAIVKRQNLVLPMVTGWKTLPATSPRPRVTGLLRAAALLGCGILAAAALTRLL